MKLQDRYDSIKKAYIVAFEKHTKIDFDYESGLIFFFGDYCFDFDTIRLVVDDKIDVKSLVQWYWFTLEYKCKINLPTYVRRLVDFKNSGVDLEQYSIEFDYKYYHLMLLNELI